MPDFKRWKEVKPYGENYVNNVIFRMLEEYVKCDKQMTVTCFIIVSQASYDMTYQGINYSVNSTS